MRWSIEGELALCAVEAWLGVTSSVRVVTFGSSVGQDPRDFSHRSTYGLQGLSDQQTVLKAQALDKRKLASLGAVHQGDFTGVWQAVSEIVPTRCDTAERLNLRAHPQIGPLWT